MSFTLADVPRYPKGHLAVTVDSGESWTIWELLPNGNVLCHTWGGLMCEVPPDRIKCVWLPQVNNPERRGD